MRRLLLLILLLAPALASARIPGAMFYLLSDSPKSMVSFEAHADKIGVVVPTWYHVDESGLVSGEPNPLVMQLARQHRMPVMPILSAGGLRDKFHQLLHDEAAKKAMIAALVEQGTRHGYLGFQFDFENIDWNDRDALSLMTKQTAEALHKHGLQLSIAVVPNAPGYAGAGGFAQWMWKFWRGAYDLKALGQAADLICLMTYDQHTRWTTPGPVGGMPWTVQHLEYALTLVPKDKLSVGIATYGYHWYTADPRREDGKEASNIAAGYIDADESFPLARQYGATIQWDPVEHESWFWFYRDGMREWVFLPDARAFRDRVALVRQYGLQGYCSWVLGAEDPKVWDALPEATR